MRAGLALILVLAAAAPARADDDPDDRALGVGAAIGAGGQGAHTYGALELRLDAAWRGVRLGLGARGVWEGGVFRRGDWARAADAVRALRYLEAHTTFGDPADAGQAGLAAGALAPARIAHVVDGHRAALDDRQRTGARAVLAGRGLALGLDIDDVLDPALVGGAASWQVAAPWGVHVGAAVDPRVPATMAVPRVHARTVVEAGAHHRWDAPRRRLELGGAVVGEVGADPGAGVGVVAFGRALHERGVARYEARAELRAGTGGTGGAFGPLYRVERRGLLDDARAGVGGALALGVAGPRGWVEIGGRVRPGLGGLGTASAGAPMGRWVQAGGWIAASPRAFAGAAELRVAWARRMFSALQLARMYGSSLDAEAVMAVPGPAWSATVWFGAATL